MYASQANMLYTLNLHSVIYQLYLNKTGNLKKKGVLCKFWIQILYWISFCKCFFSSICDLSFHSLKIFFYREFFCHIACEIKPIPSAVKLKRPNQWPTREFAKLKVIYIFPMLSSRDFIVLCFTFEPIIHFELTLFD